MSSVTAAMIGMGLTAMASAGRRRLTSRSPTLATLPTLLPGTWPILSRRLSGKPTTYRRRPAPLRAVRRCQRHGTHRSVVACRARTEAHGCGAGGCNPVSYTHLRAHETDSYLVCRLLLEKKK